MRVKFFFYGLCAFVPEKAPKLMTGDSGKLRVLLPDARNPNTEESAAGLTAHHPRLCYFVGEECRPVDQANLEVTIVDANGNPPSDGVGFRKVPPGMPRFDFSPLGSSQVQHWQWIESITDSNDRYGEVARGLLSGAVSDPLAMRAVLSGGTLSTGAVTNYKGDPILWHFRIPDAPTRSEVLRRTLAFQVLWQAEIDRPYLCYRIPPDGDPQYIALGLRETTDHAELWMTNLSADGHRALVGASGKINPDEKGQEVREDPNYRWFYKLARDYDQGHLQQLPYPWPTNHVGDHALIAHAKKFVDSFARMGGGPVRCPQTIFPEAAP
jgi:hypothetical protein